MERQFSTIFQPPASIEGPRSITFVSRTARWALTDPEGKTVTTMLKSDLSHPFKLPRGWRLTLPASARHPVMVTGLEPAPPTSVTVAVIG